MIDFSDVLRLFIRFTVKYVQLVAENWVSWARRRPNYRILVEISKYSSNSTKKKTSWMSTRLCNRNLPGDTSLKNTQHRTFARQQYKQNGTPNFSQFPTR